MLVPERISAESFVGGMNTAGHDVIVYDEEHQAAAAAIDNALKQLDSLFGKYVDELHSISNNGMFLGQAADSVRAYAEQAAEVRKIITKIADCHRITSSSFLSDVDETDQELF